LSAVLANGLPSGDPVPRAFGPAGQEVQSRAANAVANAGYDRQGGQDGQSGLQLAFLVEDQQYNSNPHSSAPKAVEHESTPPQANSSNGPRDFGNVARILAIAGAGPITVDPSGNYAGRRKRSDSSFTAFAFPATGDADSRGLQQSEVGFQEAQSITQADAPRDFGDIGRILAIAGTGSKKVDPNGGYGRRKRRSSPKLKYGALPLIDLHAVKVKSRGRHGNVLHHQARPFGSRSVAGYDLHSAANRRRRRSNDDNYIPFAVYDQRRVRTLKVEQNDFLALPLRLELEAREKARLAAAAKHRRMLLQ